jgi:hypothetical protein
MNSLKFQHDGIEYSAKPVRLFDVSFGEDKVFHLSIAGLDGGWHMGLFQMDFNIEPELTEIVIDMIAKNFDVENIEDAEGKFALFLEDADRNIAGLTNMEGYFYKTPVLRSLFQAAL